MPIEPGVIHQQSKQKQKNKKNVLEPFYPSEFSTDYAPFLQLNCYLIKYFFVRLRDK